VLAFFAALLAAAPSAVSASPAPATDAPAPEAASSDEILESAVPWWEKITVTVNDKGEQASCRYETSAAGSKACDQAMAESILTSGKGSTGITRKVTFERRFSPGAASLDAGKLAPGDLLLGRSVMYLTIDAKGAIDSCKVVSPAGDAPPAYGCDDVKKEQFRAVAGASAVPRQAFLTVLSYGHEENVA